MINDNSQPSLSKLTASPKTVGILLACSCTLLVTAAVINYTLTKSNGCENEISIPSHQDSQEVSKSGNIPEGEMYCFPFSAVKGQTVRVAANSLLNLPLNLVSPDGEIKPVQIGQQEVLEEGGRYHFSAENETDKAKSYNLAFSFSSPQNAPQSDSPNGTSIGPNSEQAINQGQKTERTISDLDSGSEQTPSRTLIYNVQKEPQLQDSIQLESLVNFAVTSKALDRNLPTENLSIFLIDLTSNTFGAYQPEKRLFPASVSKLFWLIALFKYEEEQILNDKISTEDLYGMMQDSDNNPASRILDALTNTKSGEDLSEAALAQWTAKRETINDFYMRAGYEDLNISQKNFPIPDEKLEDPIGSDKAIRGDENNPTRNYLTTKAIARLLYEIETGQAVSPAYSQQAKDLMARDFEKEAAKEYDSIVGFLGEGLNPAEVLLYSKPGWTSSSRQDAAIIYSADSSLRYILVMIGDDKAYADDETFFPEVSNYIFQQMSALSRRE